MATIRIAAAQMDVKLADREGNLSRMLAKLETAAAQGAALVVFPECALPGYCFESLEEARPYAETVPGPATNAFAAACKRLNVHAVFGMLESLRKDYGHSATLPLATLAVDVEILKAKWKLTHPKLTEVA